MAVLGACFVPVLVGVAWLGSCGALDWGRPSTWMGVGLSALGWLVVLALARRLTDSPALMAVVIAGALTLRGVALAGELELSDDLHRYVWEGALLAEGLDPYAAAPAAPELEAYRQAWPEAYARLGHADVPAAYPPLAQVVNAGLVSAAGGAERPARARVLLRLFYALCDLAACWPLARLLRRRGLPDAAVAVWAWNPLVVLEFGGAGHLDALAILCTLAALAATERGEAGGGRALGWLAAGTLTKLLPLAFVPFALRGRPLRQALVFPAALLVLLLPFVLLSGHLPGTRGLSEYAFRWESFSLLYRHIEPVFARWCAYDERWSDPRRLARALVLLAWLALGAWAWRRRFEPVRAAAWLVAGWLALTPVLHPWYLTWIVPFLALRPALSWSALVAAGPLLYWPLARWRSAGEWVEPPWLGPALALPFWALLALDLRALRRAR